MTRLIDANALHMILVKMKGFGELTAKKAIRAVENAPTIDAEPVRHAKWIKTDESDEFYGRLYRCSSCNTFVIGDMDNYCPFCGSRMDEE